MDLKVDSKNAHARELRPGAGADLAAGRDNAHQQRWVVGHSHCRGFLSLLKCRQGTIYIKKLTRLPVFTFASTENECCTSRGLLPPSHLVTEVDRKPVLSTCQNLPKPPLANICSLVKGPNYENRIQNTHRKERGRLCHQKGKGVCNSDVFKVIY